MDGASVLYRDKLIAQLQSKHSKGTKITRKADEALNGLSFQITVESMEKTNRAETTFTMSTFPSYIGYSRSM